MELSAKIRSVSPPRFSADLKSDDMKDNFNMSVNLIKSFYKETFANNTKLWIDLKKMLQSVPNIFVFQTILRQIDSSNSDLDELDSSLSRNHKEESSKPFQLMPKLKELEIICGIELFSLKSKLKIIKSKYCEDIDFHDLEDAMNMSGEDSYICDDDVVNDFLSAMLNRLMLQGKHQHVISTISSLKRQSKEKEAATKNFVTTINDTQAIQSAIEERVLDTQQSVAQMFQINHKLNFGKISMIHLVQDVKTAFKQQGMVRMMNMALMGEDLIPLHRDELQTFLNIPVENFEFESNVLRCELKNHQFISDDETSVLLMECRDCDSSSLNSLLASMKQNLGLEQLLKPVLFKVDPKFDLPAETSINDLEKKLGANRALIIQHLDQTAQHNVATKSLLREFNLLYNYSLHNPFKKFIPVTKKFDGKTFKSYENDFNLYYRMIRD